MTRPVGVTASAIVAILGSMLALLMAVLSVVALFIEPSTPRPPDTAGFVIAGAAMFAATAGLGIWTSVGLLRLRPWARTSILIIAGFLVVGCLFSLVITMAVPIPPAFSAGTGRTFRQIMALMFGIPLLIGAWWLIQFNTRSTKAAFASPADATISRRPLSITVIAWASILGGVSCILAILASAPLFLLGLVLKGWIAGVVYAFFAALALYTGKGLLDLREEARILAIGWFGFSFVHASLLTFVPSLRQGMIEFQLALAKAPSNPLPFDLGTLTNVSFVFGVIVSGSAIWFLMKHRGSFAPMESS